MNTTRSRGPTRYFLKSVMISTMMLFNYFPVGNSLAEENSTPLPRTHGVYDLVFADSAGHAMRYSLSLPSTFAESGNHALGLVLHYGGPPSGYYGRPLIEQLVGPVFDRLGMILVAPVSQGGDWTSVVNEKAIFELVSMIERTYQSDPARRLLTGYSMGGAGTWHLLESAPGYFSAAIPISGFKPSAMRECKTPIYALHSTADSIFDAGQLREMIATLAASGCNARAEFADGVDHFDVPAFAPLLEKTVSWLQDLWEVAE